MSLNIAQPKRGYLAHVLSVPPLIYPFQYNPQQITDSKHVEWVTSTEPIPTPKGFIGTVAALPSILGRSFSHAEVKKLGREGDRTVNFKFTIDGRETRPGEPERRRNEDGDILADIAILRSFVYPEILDLLDLASALTSSDKSKREELFFNHPPTATLVLGSMSMEGYVTDLKITETLFNADLNPTRAEVEITMIEKIDSISFVVDTIKRLGLTFYHTAYEDIGKVLF
ncbi:MAG TPA: hypothetical protein VH877_18330 [Polyangia bacterium]|jgi:hypothetical protein|nr:hypothetical protein [Polyangia bacterium]